MDNGWVTAIGAWGDVFASIGNILSLGLSERPGIIHYGNDPHIATFLQEQGLFREVKTIKPKHRWDYLEVLREACNPAIHKSKWLPGILAGSGIKWQQVECTHVMDIRENLPIHWWHGANLPARSEVWAWNVLKLLGLRPGEFWLLNPVSTQSTTREAHWPYWQEAVDWLGQTEENFIWIGQGYVPWTKHKNITNLANLIPTMLEVLALSRLAKGIVSTSNSLEMWTIIDRRMGLFCHNQTMSKDNYFRRWVSHPSNTIVEHENNLRIFQRDFNALCVEAGAEIDLLSRDIKFESAVVLS